MLITEIPPPEPKHPQADTATIRRLNLSVLLDEFETQAEFAQKTGIPPSLLSQLKRGASHGGRNIGANLARKIEKKLNKPSGWMDQPQGWSREIISPDATLPGTDKLGAEDLLLLRMMIDRLLDKNKDD